MIQVVTMDESLYDRYVSYVDGQPDARFGHDLAWGTVLRDTYGMQIEHLVALDGDRVVGICPLFGSKPVLGGAHYVTNPFPTYCGPLFDTLEALRAILDAIKSKTADVQYTEILTPTSLPVKGDTSLPFMENLDYTHRLSLEKGLDAVFNSFSRDHKRILRKSDVLQEMDFIVDANGSHLDQFHKLYVSIYAGKHGFIPHPKKLFRNIFDQFPEGAARVYLAKINGTYAGAMFTFWTHNEVYYGWSAVRPDSAYHPTHFLLWKIIQDAAEEGYIWFNMGEAARDHHGLNHFKRGWGTEVIEPCRYFVPGRLSHPTPRLFDRISWAKRVISRLPSFVVTGFLSPAIRFFI
ncbi:MAG TPA: GNAT family N-acetyltransferase [Anaerolineales bacterium]